MRPSQFLRVVLSIAFLFAALPENVQSHGGSGGESPSRGDDSNRPSEAFMAAWTGLIAARDRIAAAIDVEDGDRVRAETRVISELAGELTKHSGDLDTAGEKRVNGAATQISKVALHLRAAADSDGRKVWLGDAKRIDRALNAIRAQYPTGALAEIGH